jgi:hypothetical protein
VSCAKTDIVSEASLHSFVNAISLQPEITDESSTNSTGNYEVLLPVLKLCQPGKLVEHVCEVASCKNGICSLREVSECDAELDRV